MSGIKVFLVEDEMIIRNGVKREAGYFDYGYPYAVHGRSGVKPSGKRRAS